MIRPCQYSDNCYYDGTVDTNKQGYGMKSIQGRKYFWHHRCSEGNIKVPFFLTEKDFGELRAHLRKSFEHVLSKPNFVVSILEADK